MNWIFVDYPFEADLEFCKDCGYETIHMIKFLEYGARKHDVTFFLYCKECFEYRGSEVLGYKISISVKD